METCLLGEPQQVRGGPPLVDVVARGHGDEGGAGGPAGGAFVVGVLVVRPVDGHQGGGPGRLAEGRVDVRPWLVEIKGRREQQDGSGRVGSDVTRSGR